jgi:hypothetical protein
MITDKLVNCCNNLNIAPNNKDNNESDSDWSISDDDIEGRLDRLPCNLNSEISVCKH